MKKAEAVFSRFYTKPVEIYRIKNGSTYFAAAETELVCSVSADIQPFGGDVTEEEYGLRVERALKMYCKSQADIKEGNYVSVDGEMYRIKSVKNWDMGIEALIEKSGI